MKAVRLTALFTLLLGTPQVLGMECLPNSSPLQPFCLPSNYSKEDRPCEEKFQIFTAFIIDDVSVVDDISCAVTMALIMRFSWIEPRMRLNEHVFLSKLRGAETTLEIAYENRNKIWIPDLYISNLRDKSNTGFLDHPGIKIDIDTNKTIIYSHYAEVTFLCPMIFDLFPFDIHHCDFKVQSLEHTDASISFEYENNTTGILWKTQTILEHAVSFTVLEDHRRFTIFKDLNGISEQYSAIGVTVTMSRKYLPFLIDYFLPAGLFVLVSWVSFLIPPAIVPGRMALLITLFLMLVNISTSATTHSPKSDQINALQIWILSCILFVFLALMEYALILYWKHLRGVSSRMISSSDTLSVTPIKDDDSTCWSNQSTDELERRISHVDFICLILFPMAFLSFNCIYWLLLFRSSK
ncbi:glutamate-gated chloride channel alpha-like [Tigriopus californicus]|uniref:glutamate-gated chloride channel alpha-like n=1 Tax=Tigriopus californicus TaxID=6832 RepID=UPI0027DA6267|nr:glutamate-gated chloride channel alpha-like [Tigriopus californicus]